MELELQEGGERGRAGVLTAGGAEHDCHGTGASITSGGGGGPLLTLAVAGGEEERRGPSCCAAVLCKATQGGEAPGGAEGGGDAGRHGAAGRWRGCRTARAAAARAAGRPGGVLLLRLGLGYVGSGSCCCARVRLSPMIGET